MARVSWIKDGDLLGRMEGARIEFGKGCNSLKLETAGGEMIFINLSKIETTDMIRKILGICEDQSLGAEEADKIPV